MAKVIGTVPNLTFKRLKEYVVEHNGEWYIGSSTVYRSVHGERAGTMLESTLANAVRHAEIQIAAGKLAPKHYTYAELLDEYNARPAFEKSGTFKF